MENKKYIPLLTLLSFLMSTPAAPGWNPLAPNIPAERTKSIHTFEVKRKSIVVAENEPETAQSVNQSTNENKEQPSESGAEGKEKGDKNVSDAETKPIKPFKPTEEIAAEQAVDFPVDI